MEPMKVNEIAIVLLSIYSFVITPIANASTGITLKAKDGSVVFGRTIERGTFDLQSRVVILQRGHAFTGHTPDGKAGLTWEARHGFVGLDAPAMGKGLIVDGMNERGLCVNGFYHPGFAEYQSYKPASASQCIGPGDVIPYLLSTCATVEETKAALGKVFVTPVVVSSLGIAPPGHWMATDKSGKAMVIEYLKGKLFIFDAPLGVITNAPGYDWHTTNLRNYLNLSPFALPTKRIEEMDFSPLGGGSGDDWIARRQHATFPLRTGRGCHANSPHNRNRARNSLRVIPHPGQFQPAHRSGRRTRQGQDRRHAEFDHLDDRLGHKEHGFVLPHSA